VKPRALLIAAVLVGTLLASLHQLGWMDRRFFGGSALAARALAHYLAGDYAGAARFYREDLRRGVARVPADQAGAWVTMVAGDVERAEAQALMESRGAPADPEPLLTLAEIALARRDPTTALSLAGRVLAMRRDDYDALLVTAVARARQGAYSPAVDALKRALRYDAVERRPTVFLSVLEIAGELDAKPFEEQPSNLLAHLHRYLRIYDPAQARPAVRYAQRAIEVGNRPDDAHVTLALVYAKQHRPTRALAAFQQALAVNPRNTAALLGAARHHSDRGETAEEYRLIRAAFEAEPEDPFVVWAFHRLLVEKLGDYRQALALAEAAAAGNARDGEAWWRLGHVHAYIGDQRQALRAYERAVALLPRSPVLQSNLGDALAQLGRDDEAFTAYQRSVALDPFRAQPHLGLGALHGKAQRWQRAIEEYEAAASLSGGVAVGLCELYWQTGRQEAAAGCVTTVLTRDPDDLQGLALLEHVRGAPRSVSLAR
jgi:tetratricopeptide (TPR) repeat protein